MSDLPITLQTVTILTNNGSAPAYAVRRGSFFAPFESQRHASGHAFHLKYDVVAGERIERRYLEGSHWRLPPSESEVFEPNGCFRAEWRPHTMLLLPLADIVAESASARPTIRMQEVASARLRGSRHVRDVGCRGHGTNADKIAMAIPDELLLEITTADVEELDDSAAGLSASVCLDALVRERAGGGSAVGPGNDTHEPDVAQLRCSGEEPVENASSGEELVELVSPGNELVRHLSPGEDLMAILTSAIDGHHGTAGADSEGSPVASRGAKREFSIQRPVTFIHFQSPTDRVVSDNNAAATLPASSSAQRKRKRESCDDNAVNMRATRNPKRHCNTDHLMMGLRSARKTNASMKLRLRKDGALRSQQQH